MGESNNILQDVQLCQRRQDSRRGRNEVMAKLERNILLSFSDLFIMDKVVIKKEDVGRWGVDQEVATLVLGDFSQIVVEENLVRVEYSDYIA